MGLLIRKPIAPVFFLFCSACLLGILFNPFPASQELEGHFKRETITFLDKLSTFTDSENPLVVKEGTQDGSDGRVDPEKDLHAGSAREYEHEDMLRSDDKLKEKEYREMIRLRKPESTRMRRVKKLYQLRTEADWLKYVESGDEEGMPFLTKFTQKYIYDHQHPKSCEGKRFLVMKKYPIDESFGIGAITQAVSVNLALALRTGRILVYDTPSPGARFFSAVTPTSCGDSLDCIFHHISSCKTPPLPLPKIRRHGDPDLVLVDNDPVMVLPAMHGTPAVYFKTPPDAIPFLLEKLLREFDPVISKEKLKYWWRAQSAAYVLRPNGAAMERLRELRTDPKLNKGIAVRNGTANEVAMPFPLPDESWSMHVRHGDKGIEMKLVPFFDYASAAEKYTSDSPLSSQKVAFISTEDASVIVHARNTSRVLPEGVPSVQDGWTWYWSDIPRINASPEEQLKASGNRTELTLNWIFQLMTAIEADGFVGTKGSGWNRLIDQLRCVWIANCKAPFLEVGEQNSYAQYGP